MMSMRLQRKGKNLLQYSVSQVNKISYAIFTIVLIVGLFSIPIESLFSTRSIIPFIFLIISLLGLGYTEKWEFDANNKEIRSIHGVFFIVKRESIPFSQILSLEINHFTRGYQEQSSKKGDRGRNKSMTIFSIRLLDDSVKQIEIIPERVSHGRTHQAAYTIAQDMNLPFAADREFDSINKVELSDI